MRFAVFLSALLVTTSCSEPADYDPPLPPSNVVQWTATPEPARPAPGGGSLIDVSLTASVQSGWKVYSLTQKGGGPVPMSVKLDSASQYELAGEVRGPSVMRNLDPNFGIETETYGSAPAFVVPIRIPPGADTSRPIELKVRSQACSDRLCLPAQTRTVSVPIPQGT
jgi:DsbC/DsbD-like thiol-disulfide interchange protein